MEYDAEEQYQRMIRDYEALERFATNCGNVLVIGDPGPKDAAHNFFVQAYALKDWLKKDRRMQRAEDVEELINASEPLSVVADLCNSLKHAGLKKPPRSGQELSAINVSYSMLQQRLGGPFVATTRIVVTMGTANYDAFDLAAGCLRDWDAFLVKQNIVFSKKRS